MPAVAGVSFHVNSGEVYALLGPNGAGKSTTIRMICGLERPDSGSVSLKDPRVGVCPQNLVLWERLTCTEQLLFVAGLYDVPSSIAKERASQLLTDLGLLEKQGELASKLSGGMQRRLNIALALMHDPALVVLDEPEAGLDPQSRVRVREFIAALSKQKGKGVLLTTHNMDEAERVADRVGIIDHGKLLVEGTPAGLCRDFGGGGTLEVAGEAPEDLVVQLNGKQREDHLVFSTNDPMIVLTVLAKAGVHARDIRYRPACLEDVFLNLTGRELRA